MEEIKESIWSNDPYKSFGLADFIMGFFKTCWVIIKEDLIAFVNEFHDLDILYKAITISFLIFIPKIKIVSSQELGEFCPICHISCLYKILTKILVYRLKKVMHMLISPSQSVFVQNMKMLDDVLIINELVDMEKKEKQRVYVS